MIVTELQEALDGAPTGSAVSLRLQIILEAAKSWQAVLEGSQELRDRLAAAIYRADSTSDAVDAVLWELRFTK